MTVKSVKIIASSGVVLIDVNEEVIEKLLEDLGFTNTPGIVPREKLELMSYAVIPPDCPIEQVWVKPASIISVSIGKEGCFSQQQSPQGVLVPRGPIPIPNKIRKKFGHN